MRNAEKPRDSNKLMVLSLSPPRLVFRAEGPYGQITDLSLAGSEVIVNTGVGLTYRYSLSGALLNGGEVAEKEEAARLSAAADLSRSSTTGSSALSSRSASIGSAQPSPTSEVAG